MAVAPSGASRGGQGGALLLGPRGRSGRASSRSLRGNVHRCPLVQLVQLKRVPGARREMCLGFRQAHLVRLAFRCIGRKAAALRHERKDLGWGRDSEHEQTVPDPGGTAGEPAERELGAKMPIICWRTGYGAFGGVLKRLGGFEKWVDGGFSGCSASAPCIADLQGRARPALHG